MHSQPIFCAALQARNLVADLIVEDLGAAAGYRIEAGVTQAHDRVAQ